MPELSLQQAIFRGTSELNSNGLTFAPNPIALANDFEFSSNYSGAIALPSNSSKQPRHNGYEFVKLSTPNIKIPDTTLENLWECTKEHYGLTAFAVFAGTASIPIDKVTLGYRVWEGSSRNTNIISHIGTSFVNIRPTRIRKLPDQPIFEAFSQGIQPYVLDGNALLAGWAELAAPLGLADMNPVGRPVTGAREAVLFDKGFQHKRAVTIAMQPVIW